MIGPPLHDGQTMDIDISPLVRAIKRLEESRWRLSTGYVADVDP
jgi:hypothetical protein